MRVSFHHSASKLLSDADAWGATFENYVVQIIERMQIPIDTVAEIVCVMRDDMKSAIYETQRRLGLAEGTSNIIDTVIGGKCLFVREDGKIRATIILSDFVWIEVLLSGTDGPNGGWNPDRHRMYALLAHEIGHVADEFIRDDISHGPPFETSIRGMAAHHLHIIRSEFAANAHAAELYLGESSRAEMEFVTMQAESVKKQCQAIIEKYSPSKATFDIAFRAGPIIWTFMLVYARYLGLVSQRPDQSKIAEELDASDLLLTKVVAPFKELLLAEWEEYPKYSDRLEDYCIAFMSVALYFGLGYEIQEEGDAVYYNT